MLPAVPNFLSSIISLTPALASSRVLQISTPLPSASPSAFNTIGNLAVSRYLRAASGSVKFSYAAVGILYFFIKSFEKAFEPSRIAAFFFGPKHLSPAFSNSSTIPPTSGSSIPIIVKSIALSFAKATSLSNSIAPIATHSAIDAIPAFPGAQYILSTRGLLATAVQIACSLPPLPTTNTFILFPPALIYIACVYGTGSYFSSIRVLPSTTRTLPFAIRSIAFGMIIHSACSITLL